MDTLQLIGTVLRPPALRVLIAHAGSRYLVPIALVLLSFFPQYARAEQDQSLSVVVSIRGEEVQVDVKFYVAVSPQEAWAVMTDYEHATAFISNLKKSVVLSRTPKTILVSQKGTMGWGPFSVPLETVAEIHLTPFVKIRSSLVSGNMQKNEATTLLIPEAGGTRVEYHLVSIPDVWMPPLIGRSLVEYEARGRFRELMDEMLRRKVARPAAHP